MWSNGESEMYISHREDGQICRVQQRLGIYGDICQRRGPPDEHGSSGDDLALTSDCSGDGDKWRTIFSFSDFLQLMGKPRRGHPVVGLVSWPWR